MDLYLNLYFIGPGSCRHGNFFYADVFLACHTAAFIV
jgi:hypothetical protein